MNYRIVILGSNHTGLTQTQKEGLGWQKIELARLLLVYGW